jgi:tRNA pseudouridine38-40 synthase
VRRLALLLEYDGTAYAGWQRQPQAATVQAALEGAIRSVTREAVRVTGSGRTDAGVHALGQVAHLDTASRLPAARLCDAFNALLPRDIAVREALEVAPDFHARREARLRVYRYAVLARARPSALLRRYTHHVPEPLDLTSMRAGAATLVGRHDFAAFRVLGTDTRSTTCNLRTLSVEQRGDLVILTVAADRFLRQMVRRIAGALLAVGRGARQADSVAAVLASRDNAQAPPPAPACGLYLMRVYYPAGRLAGAPAGADG